MMNMRLNLGRDLYFILGVIYLELTQNFPKNYYFLTTDTHTYVCVSGVNKC